MTVNEAIANLRKLQKLGCGELPVTVTIPLAEWLAESLELSSVERDNHDDS